MICPNCNTECSSNFCPNCGAKCVRICPNCGAKCEGKFCPDCGTKLEDNQPSRGKVVVPPKYEIKDDPYIQFNDPKGKWPAFFLCLFLGWLGAHRFYTKKYASAAVYLLMLVLAPWALPFCIIYDLITIITNSFFWDHKQMVARYQASENKNRIEGWMIAMLILIPISLLLSFQSDDMFHTAVEMFCFFGVPVFGILTLDSYRKGKPFAMSLIFCLICLAPFLAYGAGIISL